MFGTFRYNTDTKDVEHVKLGRVDGFEARGYTRKACNSCRTRKVNTPIHRLTSYADKASIIQLKCSGDKNGCERCRAVPKPCTYPSNADNSADKLRRQSTQSSRGSAAVLSPDASFEKENTSRPNSHEQPEVETADVDAVGSGTPVPTPSATSADLSWTLSPIPGVTDLLWDFPSSVNQHIVDDGQESPTADKQPRTPASVFCALPPQGKRPQTPIGNMEVDNNIADILYDLESSQSSSQHLHLSDQSLISSASVSASRMLNPNQSSLTMSQQGNAGFSVHDVQQYQTEGLQRGAQPWESVLNLASTVEPPVPRSHTSQTHSSSANALATPNMASLFPTSGLASFSRSTSARTREQSRNYASERSCQCVPMMLKTLENMGSRGLGTDARDSGADLDIILMSLARGMDTTEQVLVCRQCNACIDNGMLLATIAQRLGTMAETVTTCLPSQERFHGSSPESRQLSDLRAMETGGPALHSSSNDDPAFDTSGLLGVAIFLGRYEIDAPEIRSRLVHHAVLLHINQLCAILAHIKDRVSWNWGARKLVINIESRVRESWDKIQSKISHQQ
ncbi:uncharacterized protein Z518_09612 [Rhinocladiella mackenziei CBS 650.93]|uniref:Zn(2)-C6 fungal-type domain-containing protein n=1 Tax=Rhinocladiella mackenziei CBS 650.93 TaxID=1442369 RepID=A0A0D2FEX0_9EURO|nr:uncharacterized protein Z518_09612 [Rhinocladiella mackenziei CBS 650.93]KIX00547.1 hypothetical protein Z518_09612 [Rhinocladiella mackenziei CBS 650.93]